jgi:hypothetical protein
VAEVAVWLGWKPGHLLVFRPFDWFERGLVDLYPDMYPRRIAPRVDE